MSTWSSDPENPVKLKMTGASQWNAQITKSEQTLNEIKRLLDSTDRDFQAAKHKHTDLKNLESAREKLSVLLRQIEKEITGLERILSSDSIQDKTVQKTKLRQIRSAAADLTKRFRNLCTDINSELKNREMQRKKEISITSHGFDSNREESCYNDQMVMSDVQKKEMEEEEKQMNKLSNDIILLEEMFVNFNLAIAEQGEKVENIYCNVESAGGYVDEGTKQLDKAVGYKRAALKKKLCIIGIVLAVLGILALIIGLVAGLTKRP